SCVLGVLRLNERIRRQLDRLAVVDAVRRPSEVVVEPVHALGAHDRDVRSRERRRKMPKVADVQPLRPGQTLVELFTLLEPEGKVASPLEDQRRGRYATESGTARPRVRERVNGG